jgi:hypothetical protein
MKVPLVFTAIIVCSMIAGCAGTKSVDPASVSAIGSQKLTSSFKRQGVKIEWDCFWGTGWSERTCVKGDFKAIEVTAYATSNGNSEVNRELAFRVGAAKAKAKLRHFIHEDVTSSTTVNTLSKNIEKANDRVKQRISGEEVELSDEDAAKETNWAVRENSNDIARNVTETIRVNASGILKGIYVAEEKVVDRQTVAVTIRWDKDSERAGNYLKSKFR